MLTFELRIRFAATAARMLIFACLALPLALAGETGAPVTIYLSPGDNIQAAVEAAPEGSTFVLREGMYRMQSVTPKNHDSFRGEGTVVLNGAQVLSFRAAGRDLWAADAVPQNYRHGTCQKDHPLCDYTQDLFLDNKVQQPVTDLGRVHPGFWYFDRANGKIYVADAPDGHVFEMGASPYAFGGNASDVHIQHLTVEKYRVQAQHGAIDGSGPEWVADDVEARWNHGGGIVLSGYGSQILNSYVHHNGQKGVTLKGANCQLINTEISWNNYAGFEINWEAGGTKFVLTDNLLVKSNYVHDNNGPGLWTDIDNIHTTYENNTVVNNRGDGIKHEISYDAVIRDNTVKGNGFPPAVWLANSQIMVQNSSNVDVYRNIVEVPSGYGNGITIINQNRGEGAYGPRIARNNTVHDNTITYLGTSGFSGLGDDTGNRSSNENKFDFNRYLLTDGGNRHWFWFSSKTWEEMRAVQQETHGSCCN